MALMTIHDIHDILKDLKPNHAYEVLVSHHPQQLLRTSILFTDVPNGDGWVLYSNTYDTPRGINSVYNIKIIKELCKLSTN